MGLRMKNFNIMGVHWKIQFLSVGKKKQYIYICRYREDLPEKEGLGQFADLRGGLAEKEGVVFLRGGLIPQCTL